METGGEGPMIQALPLFHIGRISEEMGNLQGLSRESFRNTTKLSPTPGQRETTILVGEKIKAFEAENHGLNPLF